MDQQYICFQRQIASSSLLNRGSRTISTYHISPRESENIDSRPWQQNARYCNICLQRYCHYTEFCESLTEEEVIDPSLSGDELVLVMDQLLSEMGGLDGRSAVSGVGGESYNMTQRHETGYGRVSGKEAVQNGQLQQYPNDIMGHDLTQATTWSSYDKLRTAPRTFNTSTAWSNSTAIQNDYRTTDVQNDYAGDHDDENDDDYKVHGSDEPVTGATLSGLEAHYRPSRCLLLGCKGEHLLKTFHKYRSHIKNVHSKGIWCSHPSCLYPRPFANKSDVDRHYRSKHGDKSDKPFKCLHDDCPARVKAFNRKDKLREHNTQYHSECCCFICPRPW
ncbi:uncharacterized protein RSE6_03948 [Rhynchosporium secalis]|uniref:C2H2-type domain-containing protein n=1 Tax=Rhynchosporium secalis TaxID=38038 RepID=A0A1E1M413_RHYSE|nr:uncharacterized protein RSE6_03948 [Rhynchosporium secalis]